MRTIWALAASLAAGKGAEAGVILPEQLWIESYQKLANYLPRWQPPVEGGSSLRSKSDENKGKDETDGMAKDAAMIVGKVAFNLAERFSTPTFAPIFRTVRYLTSSKKRNTLMEGLKKELAEQQVKEATQAMFNLKDINKDLNSDSARKLTLIRFDYYSKDPYDGQKSPDKLLKLPRIEEIEMLAKAGSNVETTFFLAVAKEGWKGYESLALEPEILVKLRMLGFVADKKEDDKSRDLTAANYITFKLKFLPEKPMSVRQAIVPGTNVVNEFTKTLQGMHFGIRPDPEAEKEKQPSPESSPSAPVVKDIIATERLLTITKILEEVRPEDKQYMLGENDVEQTANLPTPQSSPEPGRKDSPQSSPEPGRKDSPQSSPEPGRKDSPESSPEPGRDKLSMDGYVFDELDGGDDGPSASFNKFLDIMRDTPIEVRPSPYSQVDADESLEKLKNALGQQRRQSRTPASQRKKTRSSSNRPRLISRLNRPNSSPRKSAQLKSRGATRRSASAVSKKKFVSARKHSSSS